MKTVFRAGDFDRMSETLFTNTPSRQTGHFGTGYYFTTKLEKCSHLSSGKRNLYQFDVDETKMLYGTIHKHDVLRDIVRYVYARLDDSTIDIDVKINVELSYMSFNTTKENMLNVIDKVCNIVKDIIDVQDIAMTYYSIPTLFLMQLGYIGVYPSPECDNTTYGGVIFADDYITNLTKLN